MKVGDLVVSKNRYVGLYFVVVDTQETALGKRIKCLSVLHGYKTRWCGVSTWRAVK